MIDGIKTHNFLRELSVQYVLHKEPVRFASRFYLPYKTYREKGYSKSRNRFLKDSFLRNRSSRLPYCISSTVTIAVFYWIELRRIIRVAIQLNCTGMYRRYKRNVHPHVGRMYKILSEIIRHCHLLLPRAYFRITVTLSFQRFESARLA
jgi:hypothetical protein